MQDRLASQEQQVKQTQSTLDEMIKLQKLAANQSTGIKDAQTAFSEFLNFKQQIVDQSEQLEVARTNSQKMIDLQQSLISQSEPLAAAQKHAEQMVSLQQTLTDENLKLTEADTNLKSLMDIQTKLLAETDRVVEAAETLEVLGELQDSVKEQIASMQGMRREMLDIILMESTVSKATRILEPLAELGNLKRLSDAEVREAARVIMDQRDTRMGKATTRFRQIRREPAPARTTKLTTLDGNALFGEEVKGQDGEIEKLVPNPPTDNE